jgi:hypothetical protein
MAQQKQVLDDGFNAFGHLDLGRKLKVIEYLNSWRTEVPDEIKRYNIIPPKVAFDILETAREIAEKQDGQRNN